MVPMTQAHTTTAPTSTPVTVLGLGDMGRSLARAFLAAGHPTTVWNRSPGKGEDVVALGAVRAASAEEAVRASGLVVVCLVDYDASDAVLEPLAGALEGRVLVNLTSDTPARSRQTAAWAAKHSLAYLDGAIMVPVDVVGSAEALVFHSGDRAAYAAHEDTLKALGEPATYLGEDHGLAAAYDMAMLDFFYGAMGGLVHAFALARAEGIEGASLAPYLNTIAGILPPIAAYGGRRRLGYVSARRREPRHDGGQRRPHPAHRAGPGPGRLAAGGAQVRHRSGHRRGPRHLVLVEHHRGDRRRPLTRRKRGRGRYRVAGDAVPAPAVPRARAGYAGRNHTVASGGSVSEMLFGRPCAGTASAFSGSSLRTSPPPYRAASVLRTSTQPSAPVSGTPRR